MFKETQTFDLKNGEIMSLYSDKLGKRIFVVLFYDWGYINIFDETKEDDAIISLINKDFSCQERSATLENPFLDENKEYLWKAFCAILEATNCDYEKTMDIFCNYFSF